MPLLMEIVCWSAGSLFLLVLAFLLVYGFIRNRRVAQLWPFALLVVILYALPRLNTGKVSKEGIELTMANYESKPDDVAARADLMIGVARLIKDNPQDAEALTKIAQGLGLLGDTIQALKYAEVALQKAPTSVDASGLVARLDRDLVKLSSLANKVKVSPDDEEARRELAGITSRVKNRGTLAPVALQLVENADALLQQVPTPVAASAAAGSETNIIAAEGLTRAAKDSPDDPAVVRQLDSALVAVQRDTLATPGQMQRAVSVLKAAGKESAAEKLTSQLISKFPKSPEAKAARRSHR